MSSILGDLRHAFRQMLAAPGFVAAAAVTLALAKHRVVLIEADLRRPQIAARLGLDDAIGTTNVLIGRVPSVLSSGLYAIPALVGAALLVPAERGGVQQVLGAPAALCAAVCFLIRLAGLHVGLDAPKPPGAGASGPAG